MIRITAVLDAAELELLKKLIGDLWDGNEVKLYHQPNLNFARPLILAHALNGDHGVLVLSGVTENTLLELRDYYSALAPTGMWHLVEFPYSLESAYFEVLEMPCNDLIREVGKQCPKQVFKALGLDRKQFVAELKDEEVEALRNYGSISSFRDTLKTLRGE